MRVTLMDPAALAERLADRPADEELEEQRPVRAHHVHTVPKVVTLGWRTRLVDTYVASSRPFHPDCVGPCCGEGIVAIRPQLPAHDVTIESESWDEHMEHLAECACGWSAGPSASFDFITAAAVRHERS